MLLVTLQIFAVCQREHAMAAKNNTGDRRLINSSSSLVDLHNAELRKMNKAQSHVQELEAISSLNNNSSSIDNIV